MGSPCTGGDAATEMGERCCCGLRATRHLRQAGGIGMHGGTRAGRGGCGAVRRRPGVAAALPPLRSASASAHPSHLTVHMHRPPPTAQQRRDSDPRRA